MRLRTILPLLAQPPWPPLVVVTLCGWGAAIACGQALAMSALCVAAGSWYERAPRAVEAALFLASPAQIGAGWLLMLVAMMTPLLADPLQHLRHRKPAIVVFLACYFGIWLAMAPILTGIALLLDVADGLAGLPAGLSAVFLALAWQAAPWKRACLDRCRQRPEPISELRYGIAQGGWCVGACWALMLLPLAAGPAHLPAMALVSAIMIGERRRATRPCGRAPLAAREGLRL
jgi:predicted metal-binding membrane protein